MGASTDFLSDKSMKANIQLFLHVKDNPKINLDEKDSEMLFSFIEFIRSKLMRTDHIYRKEIVQSLFMGFCYEVSAIFRRTLMAAPQQLNRNEILFKELMQLIVTHYKTERSVGFYAGNCALPISI